MFRRLVVLTALLGTLSASVSASAQQPPATPASPPSPSRVHDVLREVFVDDAIPTAIGAISVGIGVAGIVLGAPLLLPVGFVAIGGALLLATVRDAWRDAGELEVVRRFRAAHPQSGLAADLARAARPTPNRDAAADDPDPTMRHLVVLKDSLATSGYGIVLDSLRGAWGSAPMRSTAYLTNIEGGVGRSILAGAANAGVDPTLLSVSIFQEGLNLWVDHQLAAAAPIDMATANVDGFSDIGADTFYDRMPELKRLGYLRKSYDGAVRYTGWECPGGDYTHFEKCKTVSSVQNEAGTKVSLFYFRNATAAAEGVGALLKFCGDRFRADARALGVDLSAMPKDEQDGWTYLYYNAGEGLGRRILAESHGRLPRDAGRHGAAIANAQRVASSVGLYERLGVFTGIDVARYVDTTYVVLPAAADSATNGGFHH